MSDLTVHDLQAAMMNVNERLRNREISKEEHMIISAKQFNRLKEFETSERKLSEPVFKPLLPVVK